MKKCFLIMALCVVGTTARGGVDLGKTVITTGESFGTSVRDTAKNVTVITAKEIEQRGVQSVADALMSVPGVYIRRMDGASPTIDLRGQGATASANTIVLLDGIPTGFNLNTLPVSEVERIEVIPSGGAVMYGDGAIGGVVNIITKSPKDKLNYGSVGLETGSWETNRARMSYGTKIGDRLLIDTSYVGYESMDYRERNDEYKNDEDKRESFWLRGRYLLDAGSLELRYNHSKTKDYYTGYLEKNQYEANQKHAGTYGGLMYNTSDIWNLSYKYKIFDNLDTLIYGGYTQDKNKMQNSETKEWFIKPQVKYTYMKDSYIILGGDYRNGKTEFKDPVKVNGVVQKAPNDERKSYAGYIINRTTVGDFQFTQGYRREKVKYKYSTKIYDASWNLSEINPKSADYSDNNSFELGMNYLYSDTGNLYFNYTRATRTPTIGDAGAWWGDVKTQKNNAYEIGIRDMFGITTLSTSVFYIESSNEIYYDKIFDTNGYNRNFDGKVRRIGTQLSLNHYFDSFELRENLSFIDPKVTSGQYDGKQFAGVSKWQGNIGATWNVNKNITTNLDVYYMDGAYAEDDFANYFSKSKPYVTVDLNIAYTFDTGLKIYTGVTNLFDKRYCNTETSTRSPYGDGPRKVYYPANGRAVYGGFEYKF